MTQNFQSFKHSLDWGQTTWMLLNWNSQYLKLKRTYFTETLNHRTRIFGVQYHVITIANENKETPPYTYLNSQYLTHWQHQMLTRRWSNRNSHSLMMGMQMVQPLWKTLHQFFFFHNKTKHITLTIQWGNVLPGIYPKRLKTYTQNMHTDIYRNFLQNCQNVEVIKLSFNRWMSKLW